MEPNQAERLAALEFRLASLEAHNAIHCEELKRLQMDRDRFLNALKAALREMFAAKNPMVATVLAMMPKDVKKQIEDYIAA